MIPFDFKRIYDFSPQYFDGVITVILVDKLDVHFKIRCLNEQTLIKAKHHLPASFLLIRELLNCRTAFHNPDLGNL